ncbi:two-component sensor histidine kinase [Mycobacterium sp. CBMA 234]|uniref:sensor histidine kinase n=1 Tax=Mycolicibacterium sp. CBMA 234 TaxID=1918495 RepID=UPI0012DF8A99|nr:histidine kinase [Mycolicibacterium sp. CBMA 234]MUL65012.1 two-component sensor histidine kinase [Mycolicibacterium sp. CBMA 234]
MNRRSFTAWLAAVGARLAAVPAPVVDVALVAVSAVDVWNMVDGEDGPVAIGFAVVGCVALLARRRAPLLVTLLTLPSVLLTLAVIAAQIALFTLALRTRNRAVLACCILAFATCYMVPWPTSRVDFLSGASLVVMLGYGLANAAAPVFLGQLVQARHDLRAQVAEIAETREHERLLIAQKVLDTERAHLAREMHDVVSHQVSLIAVQAGALQVSSHEPQVKDAAAAIRRLSVDTLDELRHMVRVLRTSGSRSTELTPQPTLDQLDALVSGSGISAELVIDSAIDVPTPMQRTIYRTVQEALTNVRKHAPGASAMVEITREDDGVRTIVTNTAPTRPALHLPSAQHGLIGLRQRAELLGGTLDAGPTADLGFEICLFLPDTPSPGSASSVPASWATYSQVDGGDP